MTLYVGQVKGLETRQTEK